jgi:hypothetical protein
LVLAQARAEPADDVKRRAALSFDQGVLQFGQAQYEGAARAFLAADDLVPSSRALANAIAAARRANHHLLVARAAQRALQRPGIEAEVATAAREALADAAAKLALIDVHCTPEPCTIKLDGEAVAPGIEYALPGTHDFAGEGPHGARASEHLSCVAGASYRVALQLAPATSDDPRMSPPPRESPVPVAAPAAHPAVTPDAALASPDRNRPSKPLPPAAFVVGGAATLVFAALTTWSGLQTLSARNLHESNPPAYDHDEVSRLALRTDFLLLGTVLLGGATAAAGLLWIDWHSGSKVTSSLLPGGGVGITAQGHF